MRELAKAGVLVGFCGGGGTPLFSATEKELDVAWLQPQSEYRPTEYLQQWVRFWFDDNKRLEAAKLFQLARLNFLKKQWLEHKTFKEFEIVKDKEQFLSLLDQSYISIKHKSSSNEL